MMESILFKFIFNEPESLNKNADLHEQRGLCIIKPRSYDPRLDSITSPFDLDGKITKLQPGA